MIEARARACDLCLRGGGGGMVMAMVLSQTWMGICKKSPHETRQGKRKRQMSVRGGKDDDGSGEGRCNAALQRSIHPSIHPSLIPSLLPSCHAPPSRHVARARSVCQISTAGMRRRLPTRFGNVRVGNGPDETEDCSLSRMECRRVWGVEEWGTGAAGREDGRASQPAQGDGWGTGGRHG